MKKAAITVLFAMVGATFGGSLEAAPLSPAKAMSKSAHVSLLSPTQGKRGPVLAGTAHLRTFRPGHVWRPRPVIAVRPGRPHVHGNPARKRTGNLAYRKRPHPFYVHAPHGVPPDAQTVTLDKYKHYDNPLSPDFCRYWGDRGEINADVCW